MKLFIIILSILFIPIFNAYAYLDPGSGSAIIQGVIAALMGGAFFIKLYWGKIITLFKKDSPKKLDK